MNKFARFVTEKKTFMMIAFAVITILSVVGYIFVDVNYNLTHYLPDSSETKKAVTIMEEDFGMAGNVQACIENIDKATATALADEFNKLDGVLTVNFDADSDIYYKDNTALFIIMVDGDEYSENAAKVKSSVEKLIDERLYDAYYGGSVIERQVQMDAITKDLPIMLIICISIALVIMLLTSTSYIEPFIFLAVAGVGVIINLGTNIMFGTISYITQSVAAILQLALSVDYGICLLHSYHKHQKTADTNTDAMREAICECLKPVSCSALTTVAGMFALLFMSFRIGFDIGMVLMKGIIISAVTSFTLLPTILLVSDKALKKTVKKPIRLPHKSLSTAAVKAHKPITAIAALVIIAGFVLQLFNVYTFTDSKPDNAPIVEKFGHNNQLAIVFENEGDIYEKQERFINTVKYYTLPDGTMPFTSYTAYTNTVGEMYSIDKTSEKMGVARDDVLLLYAMYELKTKPASQMMSVDDLLKYARQLIDTDSDAQDFIDDDTVSMLDKLSALLDTFWAEYGKVQDTLTRQLTRDECLSVLRDEYGIYNFFLQFVLSDIYDGNKTMPFITVMNALLERGYITDSEQAEMVRQGMAAYNAAKTLHRPMPYNKVIPTVSDIAESILGTTVTLPVSEDIILGIYVKYMHETGTAKITEIPAGELLNFVIDNMSNQLLAAKLPPQAIPLIKEAQADVAMAEELFKSDKYSRLLLTVDLPNEGDNSYAFSEYISRVAKNILGENTYVAGEIVTTYDLQNAFDTDNLIISIITFVSIFIIVLFTFRSFLIPILLTLVIAGAVWMTMAVTVLAGAEIFFMSYIIATCILMGATIDYGILVTNNYVSARRTSDRKQAVAIALQSAIPTIFTSGFILISCGFTIFGISGQLSISGVGLLLGVGATISAIMVLFSLPAILYIADKAVLKQFNYPKKRKPLPPPDYCETANEPDYLDDKKSNDSN